MNSQTRQQITGERRHGMTLLGLVAVMAVLAILAAVMVPALIRKMDQVAGDKETATLLAMSAALDRSILRHRYIPCHTNWAATIAAELGQDVGDVLFNLRRQPRIFLIDPALQIGASVAGQPYQQGMTGSAITNAGKIIPPVNPRMLLVSSISEPLPAGLTTGVPTAEVFTNLWNWHDTGSAPPAGALCSGWRGARDLKVQRIGLSPLFVRLILTTYASLSNGLYSIDWQDTNSVPASNTIGQEGYYLQNTILGLITHLGQLDSQQVLIRDSSFVYNESVWRGSIVGGIMMGGIDLAGIVTQFLAAPPNPNAQNNPGNQQQVLVVQTMTNYMGKYEVWEAAGFPQNGAYLDQAIAAQDAMMTAVRGLYKKDGSINYFPPEEPCP